MAPVYVPKAARAVVTLRWLLQIAAIVREAWLRMCATFRAFLATKVRPMGERRYAAAWPRQSMRGRMHVVRARARAALDSRHWHAGYSVDLAAGRV